MLMMTSLLLLPLVARQKHKWQTGRLEQGKYVTFSLKLVVRTSVPSKWIAALASGLIFAGYSVYHPFGIINISAIHYGLSMLRTV